MLWGFYHVLTPDGFADVRVPDVDAVIRAVVEQGLDLDSILYTVQVGPMRVCDVLWGWQKQIAKSGQPFYGHKFGFTRNTLGRMLKEAHFGRVLMASRGYGLQAVAYKRESENERD